MINFQKYIPENQACGTDYRGIVRDRKYFLEYLDLHAGRFQEIVAEISNFSNQSLKILDIGVGYGFLARRLTDMGHSVVGIEHPSAKSICDNIDYSDFGIDIRYLDLETLECLKDLGSFDVVIYSEILEHLELPVSVQLEMLKFYCKDSGILLITTPNFCSFRGRFDVLRGKNIVEKFPQTPPFRRGHVREYTMAEVLEDAEGAGLRVAKSRFSNVWDQFQISPNRKRNWKGVVFDATNYFMCNLYHPFRSNMVFVLEKKK